MDIGTFELLRRIYCCASEWTPQFLSLHVYSLTYSVCRRCCEWQNETLCLHKQHDKNWTGPYVCFHTDDETGFLGYVLTICLTAAQLVESVCLVCDCVYILLYCCSLFPKDTKTMSFNLGKCFPHATANCALLYFFKCHAFFKRI